jgi:hypothetical protein
MAMKFRRKEDRNLCAELIEIRWKGGTGEECREFGTLEDISVQGLSLGIESPIPVGEEVTVLYPNGKYEGEVRYCRSDELGNVVGVKFAPGYSWSPRDFRPAHMVQFRLRAVNKSG